MYLNDFVGLTFMLKVNLLNFTLDKGILFHKYHVIWFITFSCFFFYFSCHSCTARELAN